MLIEIDCLILNNKQDLLEALMIFFEEMYAPNFDALIDAMKSYDEKLEINISNINSYESPSELYEIFDIVNKENTNITINIK